MARDDFSVTVKKNLKMRAALICSNSDCRKMTVAPSKSDENGVVCLGKVAHITAASEGGPRYKMDMSPKERMDISNAIYLCSGCADLIDKNNGQDFSVEVLIQWKKEHEQWTSSNLNKSLEGRGGNGGSGTIQGDRGVVVGGRGGRGGKYGVGGNGGGGIVEGNDAVVIGGDGGDAGTEDGRGGRGARGPTERLGFHSSLWGFGRGGSGKNDPEYDRKIELLEQIRNEYLLKFPEDARYINAGIDIVPKDRINQRLIEYGENWQIEIDDDGMRYVLPPLI